ncbi:MAG: class I mannose-6-phosphate isomerase [Clostridia bacterium]|nr:class I mannose-6-phosphate isomerase [Clostridia bacterium]
MFDSPIFFHKNRVGRVYIGGKLFSAFFGDDSADSYEPEEWIASNVSALNKNPKTEKEGVSKVVNSDLYFDELVEKYPQELLGSHKKLRILVKVLDSAIRLPAQAHPDKEFSRKYFNSEYGKTECWIVLDTRPDAKIYFGFKNGVTLSEFEKAIDDSERDKDAMERLMLEIKPEKNGVYLVPAKTVHAIGKGCLILEIQEPTDFTIQPERYCGEYKLSDKEMYLGLTRTQAVECFDFAKAPNAKIEPVVIEDTASIKTESLICKKNTDCFVVNRITLSGGKKILNIEDSYAIYIVTNGEGILSGNNYSKTITKGDYFFMPACLMGKFSVSGNVELVECY